MKNEYKVTLDMFYSWALEGKFKGRRLRFFIMWCAFGVFYLGIAFLVRAIIAPLGYSYAVLFGLFLFLSVFSFYCAFLRDVVRAMGEYERSKKRYKPLWIRSVELTEEKIVLTDGEVTLTYGYLDVDTIINAKKAAVLSLTDGTLIRLYHDKFISSDTAECIAFIEKRKAEEQQKKDEEEKKKPRSAKY